MKDSLRTAVDLHQQGKLYEAERFYIQILERQPNNDNALHLLGIAHGQTGRHGSGLELIRTAITINPTSSTYRVNLGNILFETGDLDEAARSYQKALDLEADNRDAVNGLAMVLNEQGQYETAIQFFQKALSLDSTYTKAYNNLGISYWKQGNLDAAIENLEKAIGLDPGYAEAYNNLSNVLWDQKKYGAAIEACRKALGLRPDFAEAYKNMAEKLWSLGEVETASECYDEAIRINPVDIWKIRSAMILPPIYRSPDEVARYRNRVDENLDALVGDTLNIEAQLDDIGANFYLAYQGENDREIQEKLARILRAAHIPTRRIAHTASHNAKMKIGFISTFFKDYHTIGKLNQGIIGRISRDRFHVSVFSVGPKKRNDTVAFRDAADAYFELPKKLSDIQDAVLRQNIDLLFFTDIGMDPITYTVAFSRLAPVQCVTWGHPVTTGIETVDYFISSKDLETPSSHLHYTEKLIELDSLPTYYYRPNPPSSIKNRSSFGLSEDKTIYLCPQSLFKFHPGFDRYLADILRIDTQGQFVLISGAYAQWNELLMQRFKHTIPDVVDRIVFLPRQDYNSFLNLIAVSDIMLDTFHFSGGNTTFEALSTGTPVVTLPSEFMRGRVTQAIYKKMGVMDLVASSPETYVDLSVRIGTDKAYRERMKQKILANNHRIYEDAGIIQELESFFECAIKEARRKRVVSELL